MKRKELFDGLRENLDDSISEGDTDTEMGWGTNFKKQRVQTHNSDLAEDSAHHRNCSMFTNGLNYHLHPISRAAEILIRFWLPDGRKVTKSFQVLASVQVLLLSA